MRVLSLLLLTLLLCFAAVSAQAGTLGQEITTVTYFGDNSPWVVAPTLVHGPGTPTTESEKMPIPLDMAQVLAGYKGISTLSAIKLTMTLSGFTDGWALTAQGTSRAYEFAIVPEQGSTGVYSVLIDNAALISELWNTPESELNVWFAGGRQGFNVSEMKVSYHSSATPIPAAALLLGTGVCSLLALRRRVRS